jgi:hypothetical protein
MLIYWLALSPVLIVVLVGTAFSILEDPSNNLLALIGAIILGLFGWGLINILHSF